MLQVRDLPRQFLQLHRCLTEQSCDRLGRSSAQVVEYGFGCDTRHEAGQQFAEKYWKIDLLRREASCSRPLRRPASRGRRRPTSSRWSVDPAGPSTALVELSAFGGEMSSGT